VKDLPAMFTQCILLGKTCDSLGRPIHERYAPVQINRENTVRYTVYDGDKHVTMTLIRLVFHLPSTYTQSMPQLAKIQYGGSALRASPEQ
jgi:hypothetical protein